MSVERAARSPLSAAGLHRSMRGSRGMDMLYVPAPAQGQRQSLPLTFASSLDYSHLLPLQTVAVCNRQHESPHRVPTTRSIAEGRWT
jgi:hypothetical protein